MSKLTNELNSLLNWEVQTTNGLSAQNENILQNQSIWQVYNDITQNIDRMVCKNRILQDIETVKHNKTNVLRLIDDIKIDCGITLEIIPFDKDKRVFLVNDTANSESEKYKFLFSAKTYKNLFLLLKGFIIGLGIQS